MNILRVVSDLYPYSYGGLGVHVHELSKDIVQMGHKVTIFTCEKNPKSFHEFIDGYEVFRFKPMLNFLGNSITSSMILPLLNKMDAFDIVHAHSHLFFSTNITAFIRKLKKTPLIVTNHGFVSQSVPMNIQKIVLPRLAKWTYLNADAVICYTFEMKKEMENWGVSSDNVRIIHNGVNIDLFKPQNIDNKEYDIIWIGRYVPGKGLEFFVQSISDLTKDFKNIRVLMVGSGPLKKQIEKMTNDLGLTNHITFIEKISNNDLPFYYNKSKVFVLTSLEEGVPRTILEAMACGIPVVCSDLPQLKKIVDGCGILVQKKDISNFSKAIAKILYDKQLSEKLGINAHSKVKENYSWADTVRKTIRLYEELIN